MEIRVTTLTKSRVAVIINQTNNKAIDLNVNRFKRSS
jgi:hypothetical protein